jgi:hypothetical protein
MHQSFDLAELVQTTIIPVEAQEESWHELKFNSKLSSKTREVFFLAYSYIQEVYNKTHEHSLGVFESSRCVRAFFSVNSRCFYVIIRISR